MQIHSLDFVVSWTHPDQNPVHGFDGAGEEAAIISAHIPLPELRQVAYRYVPWLLLNAFPRLFIPFSGLPSPAPWPEADPYGWHQWAPLSSVCSWVWSNKPLAGKLESVAKICVSPGPQSQPGP